MSIKDVFKLNELFMGAYANRLEPRPKFKMVKATKLAKRIYPDAEEEDGYLKVYL